MLEQGADYVNVVDSSKIRHSFALEEAVEKFLDDGFAAGDAVQSSLRQTPSLYLFYAVDDDAGNLRGERGGGG